MKVDGIAIGESLNFGDGTVCYWLGDDRVIREVTDRAEVWDMTNPAYPTVIGEIDLPVMPQYLLQGNGTDQEYREWAESVITNMYRFSWVCEECLRHKCQCPRTKEEQLQEEENRLIECDDNELFGEHRLKEMRQERIRHILDEKEAELELLDNEELFEDWDCLREQEIERQLLDYEDTIEEPEGE